ncbi:scp-like extracellular protein [Diaporthe eres]|uniref:SCP domain-containing protein n=1 Tax=Diaporthe vaccinii TaxID=105482 RepID=A0ABR4EIL1_9PEZI|nr:scp-like extracellular protein [Diaporthe eres]
MQISIQTVLAAALLAPSVSCAPFDWSNWGSWGQNTGAAASTASATPTASASAAASTSSSSSSNSSLSTDAQKALDAHNAARSDVGTAALVWDETLASNAQAYGETLVSQYGSSGTLEHSQISDQGENLYWQGSSGDDIPMTNAANMWIAEKSEYNGETITESNYMNFGHYTQVVWKDTSKVGIAAVSDGSGGFYVVARYTEPGNMIGEAAY